MSGREIHADASVLDDIRTELQELGRLLRDATEPVTGHGEDITEGAQQFSGSLTHGVAAFTLSWTAAFDATSETAGNIAANVGGFSVDLEALDLGSR